MQVITALTWAHNLLKVGTTLIAQLSWVIYLTKRIMSTCAICLFSESNVSMLTAVNLSVVK